MVAARVAPTGSKPISWVFRRVGITAPRTTRSKPSRTIANQQSHTGHEERAEARVVAGRVVDMENLAVCFGDLRVVSPIVVASDT
ncbi:hypothetical protein GCM10027449_09260 [Sinomonas notoginsengisoli]